MVLWGWRIYVVSCDGELLYPTNARGSEITNSRRSMVMVDTSAGSPSVAGLRIDMVSYTNALHAGTPGCMAAINHCNQQLPAFRKAFLKNGVA